MADVADRMRHARESRAIAEFRFVCPKDGTTVTMFIAPSSDSEAWCSCGAWMRKELIRG